MAKQRNSVCKLAAAVALAASTSGAVQAASIINEGDWNVRWDNTFKYSAIGRTESPDHDVTGTVPAIGEASLNFKRGSLVSNRVDWRTELDVIWKGKMGFRISGAAWYDDAYAHGTDYIEQASHHFPNGVTTQYSGFNAGEFDEHTEDWYTGTADLQDAFVFYNFDIAGMGATVRAGRHTVYYGNSLFGMGVAHSAAGYMTSIDVDKALSSPGTEAKELFMPSNKISMDLSITDNLNLSMFYGLEYLPSRLPTLGAFFAPAGDLNIEGDIKHASFSAALAGNGLPADGRLAAVPVKFDVPDDVGSEYGFSLQYYWQDIDAEIAFHYVNSYSRGTGNAKLDNDCGADGNNATGAVSVATCSAKYAHLLTAGNLSNVELGNNLANFLNANNLSTAGTNPNGYFGIAGELQFAVKEDIDVFGLSIQKEWKGISWGADLTYMRDAFLGNSFTLAAAFPAIDENDPNANLTTVDSKNPQGAEGEVVAFVWNAVGLLNANSLWDGGSWIVEHTMSQILDVYGREDLQVIDDFGLVASGSSAAGADANLSTGHIAHHVQVRFAPTWFQIMPSVDLSVPISVGHGFGGQPNALSNQHQFSVASIGANFNISQKYDLNLAYNVFGGSLSGTGHNLKDRDNISLTIKATF